MKEQVIKILEKELKGKLKKEEIEKFLEVPPSPELGDFAFPCFSLAKLEKKSPLLIAQELTEKLRKDLPKEISNVDSKAGYINFFVNKTILAKNVLKEVVKKGFGQKKINKKIGIEYPSPNTNKALHVGHLRNIAIGESTTNILKFNGNKIFHLNLFNDRGILISKSILGYQMYGKGKTPQSEKLSGDAFVGKYYVLFSKESKDNPDLEEKAQDILRKWESGDKEIITLWNKMNNWAYEGMQKTFDKFGLSKINKNYYESELYLKGKEIINEGLNKQVFKKRQDGAVIINLEDEKLGEKVLLREDGTAVYMTTDLYLAKKKIDDFKLDSSYYVVGNDQIYHFQVLFTILNKLGIKKDWKHLAYGMVELPTGRMKSRDGTAISAEEFITETQNLAKQELEKRYKLSKQELENRSLKIALAAVKYTLLKTDITQSMIFNPDEAISFEGNTGPYLLYSYARANSITKKAAAKKKEIKIIDLKKEEISLLKKLDNFPKAVEDSYTHLAPNIIANYTFELAQQFNEFYHACPVLGNEQEAFRLELVKAFKIIIKNSLNLLGIETVEEM